MFQQLLRKKTYEIGEKHRIRRSFFLITVCWKIDFAIYNNSHRF